MPYGGQTFILPENYFGFGDSLSRIAGTVQNYADRRTQRDEKKMAELLRQLEVAGQVFGKGSPQYAALARQITGEQTAQPIVPLDEQQLRRLGDAQARMAAGQGTPDDATLVNQALYGNPLGLPGMRESAEGRQKVEKIEVTQAERGEMDEAERRRTLQGQGYTPGTLQASLDINKITAADAEIANVRARTALTQEQVRTERAQQATLLAQAQRLRAEAQAAVASGSGGGDGSGGASGPFSRKDADYIAGIARDMSEKGYGGFTPSIIVNGMQGRLPAEQQTQFNDAYSRYVNEQRALFENNLQKAIDDNPNSPRAVASRNLQLYMQAERAGTKMPGVSDEQVRTWQATAMGGEVAREERLFRDRWVIRWTPTTPTGTTTEPTGFDPAQITSSVDRMVRQFGIEGARERIATQDNPTGRALLEDLNKRHGQPATERAARPAPSRETKPTTPSTPQTRMAGRRSSALDSLRRTKQARINDYNNAINQLGARKPTGYQYRIARLRRQRDSTVAAINRDIERLENQLEVMNR
jgi:hypothetical protein